MSSVWGGLAGLGDSLNEYGTHMYKSTLADKLEKAREERAAERAMAKEARDEARADALVSSTEFYTNADGTLMKRSLNRKGETLREDLATSDEIQRRQRDADRARREEQMHSLDMDGKALSNALNTKKLADYDDDKSLDRQLRQAQINAANYRASGGGSRGRGSALDDETDESSTPAANLGTAVLEILSKNKPIIELMGDDVASGHELERLARESLLIGAREGVDPHSIFQVTLRRWAKEKGGGNASPVIPSRD